MENKLTKTEEMLHSIFPNHVDKPFADFHIKKSSCTNNPGYIEYYINTMEWMLERVEIHDEWQEKLDKFFKAELEKDEYLSNDNFLEMFIEHLRDNDHEITGIYGEGDEFFVNTCNEENILDEDIIFTYAEVDNYILYFLMQTDNIVVLTENGNYSEPSLFNNSDGTIHCYKETEEFKRHNENLLPGIPTVEKCYTNWYTDDSYHWYMDGGTQGKQLEEYPMKRLPDDNEWLENKMDEWDRDEWLGFYQGKYDHPKWEKEVLCFYDSGNVLCPICGCILSFS